MIKCFAYVSTATKAFQPEELDALLLDARGFNASVGVTGVLFFHDGRFFQYIEGTDSAIAQVRQRIVGASSHAGMETLLDANAGRRYFDAWHMGFCDPAESAIQELANAVWTESMPITRDEFDGFQGVELATYYWNKWCADTRQLVADR